MLMGNACEAKRAGRRAPLDPRPAADASSWRQRSMIVMKRAFWAAAALSICVLGASALERAHARPITPNERRLLPLTGNIAFCADPSVLQSIVERFQIREGHYWSSGLALLSFDDIRETGYRTTGYDYVPRRYCQARATFNDDKYRQVVYWVGESSGFAGYGFGVEWCVQGLDRNYADGPNCRAVRP